MGIVLKCNSIMSGAMTGTGPRPRPGQAIF